MGILKINLVPKYNIKGALRGECVDQQSTASESMCVKHITHVVMPPILILWAPPLADTPDYPDERSSRGIAAEMIADIYGLFITRFCFILGLHRFSVSQLMVQL